MIDFRIDNTKGSGLCRCPKFYFPLSEKIPSMLVPNSSAISGSFVGSGIDSPLSLS